MEHAAGSMSLHHVLRGSPRHAPVSVAMARVSGHVATHEDASHDHLVDPRRTPNQPLSRSRHGLFKAEHRVRTTVGLLRSQLVKQVVEGGRVELRKCDSVTPAESWCREPTHAHFEGVDADYHPSKRRPSKRGKGARTFSVPRSPWARHRGWFQAAALVRRVALRWSERRRWIGRRFRAHTTPA